jgi:hypothetical protein
MLIKNQTYKELNFSSKQPKIKTRKLWSKWGRL